MLTTIKEISKNLDYINFEIFQIELDISKELKITEWRLDPVEWKVLKGKQEHVQKLRKRIRTIQEEKNNTNDHRLRNQYDKLTSNLQLEIIELKRPIFY